MSLERNLKGLSTEEIVDAFVLTETLSAKEKKQADQELAKHRKKRRGEVTDSQKLYFDLLQLKFQLEDYLKEDIYKPEYTFGYFLERYLILTNKKKKELAMDIQIHETLLSHLISNRRYPNESIMVRLELHSGNTIPAIDWFKLIEKEKEFMLKTDLSLREKESQFVSRSLQLNN